MGGYFSSPRTEKVSEEGSNENLTYAASGMQGWRSSMEDSHVAVLKVDAPVFNESVARVTCSLIEGEAEPIGSGDKKGTAATCNSSGECPNDMEYGVCTMDQEDADLLKDAAVFAVFDGHGGKTVADFCSDRLIDELIGCSEIRRGNWREGFPTLFHRLDEALVFKGRSARWGNGNIGVGAGCTAVVALVDLWRNQCLVAHAGDSRAVLCRSGKAIQLTRDHKPHLPQERGRIHAAGGQVSRSGRVNHNLNLSRSIGDLVYKRNHLCAPKDQIISAEPDMCRFDFVPEDEFLVLACDGLWEMKTTSQVICFVRAAVRSGQPLKTVCERLLDACLSPEPEATRYAGCDNMTVVIVNLTLMAEGRPVGGGGVGHLQGVNGSTSLGSSSSDLVMASASRGGQAAVGSSFRGGAACRTEAGLGVESSVPGATVDCSGAGTDGCGAGTTAVGVGGGGDSIGGKGCSTIGRSHVCDVDSQGAKRMVEEIREESRETGLPTGTTKFFSKTSEAVLTNEDSCVVGAVDGSRTGGKPLGKEAGESIHPVGTSIVRGEKGILRRGSGNGESCLQMIGGTMISSMFEVSLASFSAPPIISRLSSRSRVRRGGAQPLNHLPDAVISRPPPPSPSNPASDDLSVTAHGSDEYVESEVLGQSERGFQREQGGQGSGATECMAPVAANSNKTPSKSGYTENESCFSMGKQKLFRLQSEALVLPIGLGRQEEGGCEGDGESIGVGNLNQADGAGLEIRTLAVPLSHVDIKIEASPATKGASLSPSPRNLRAWLGVA